MEKRLEQHRTSLNPLYSICITTKNSIHTIESSLTSILSQLDDSFEVVVVDGGSTDGTVEYLTSIKRNYPNMKLISQPCSRGTGRDIAYRNSRGRYLIQQVDTDTVYNQSLKSILNYYHSNEKLHNRYALYVESRAAGYLICSSESMRRIGGWPDLQWAEDIYVYFKLSQVCFLEYNRSLGSLAVQEHLQVSRSGRMSLRNFVEAYILWRDLLRVFPLIDSFGPLHLYLLRRRSLLVKFGNVLLFCLAALTHHLKRCYKLHGPEIQSYSSLDYAPWTSWD